MERTYIADIKNNLGKPVLVQGFVENLRDSKYMAFIVLKDFLFHFHPFHALFTNPCCQKEVDR